MVRAKTLFMLVTEIEFVSEVPVHIPQLTFGDAGIIVPSTIFNRSVVNSELFAGVKVTVVSGKLKTFVIAFVLVTIVSPRIKKPKKTFLNFIIYLNLQ